MIIMDGPQGKNVPPRLDPRSVVVLKRLLTAGVTQEVLAHEIGVTVSTVNRWVNGHANPSKLAADAIYRKAVERGVSTD